MNRLQQKYQQELKAQLQKELKLKNAFAVPQIKKIVVNTGITDFPANPRQRVVVAENVVEQFKVITGQTPQITKARKSIAGFKLREGDVMGVMVTLRGEKMWDFLDKLISIGLPRVKDFRGIPMELDGHGNYSFGIQEQIIFPEIDYDKIDSIRGLQVTIVTSAVSDEHGLALLKALKLPFVKAENK